MYVFNKFLGLTCCKLLKKIKNTNLFQGLQNKCLDISNGWKSLIHRGEPGSISKSQGGLPQGIH